MGTTQKILTTTLWGMAVLAMLLILALSSAKKPTAPMLAVSNETDDKELPVLFDLPKFKLLDQDGKDLTDDQLRGKPFVASFVFTHCAGPCPMIFGKMASMQQSIPNPNVKLVTFTVDPTRDTPEVMKQKAQQLGAQEGRWTFVTGDADSIHQLLKDMYMATPGPEDDPLMHTTDFYLFDASGNCRGKFMSNVPEQMDELTRSARTLAQTAPPRKS